MLNLFQAPYSPYCIVQRRILEYAGVGFRITNVPNSDRSLIWKLSREQYYQVPFLMDGTEPIFELDDNSQNISRHIDEKLGLDLFPREWDGLQDLLWRYIENDLEGIGFKLNDCYYEENIPKKEHLQFIRHKERKFGKGCLAAWQAQKPQLLKSFEQALEPFEAMLATKPFLLADRPLFVDFDLFGVIGNMLYAGHYQLPKKQARLREWHGRMAKIKKPAKKSEKLHT